MFTPTLRNSKVEAVDDALCKWFVSTLASNLLISGEILRLKEENFESDLGFDTFHATNGFFDRWKKRYGIVYKHAHGEKLDANPSSVEDWLSTVFQDVLKRYPPEDIYNADETGFYYRALPNGSHVFKSTNLSGGKVSKDRLTLLVCASVTGEKCPLLIIGKSKLPRCFRGVPELPIEYRSNTNALMTSTIFEQWLRKWDRECIMINRRIALILDNCPAIQSLTFKI